MKSIGNLPEFRGAFSVVTHGKAATSEIETVPEFKTSEKFNARVAAVRYGSGIAKISYVELLDDHGRELVDVNFDRDVRIRVYFIIHSNAVILPNYHIIDDKKI